MKKRKIIALVSITILLIVVASILIIVYALDETKDLRSDLVLEDENHAYIVRFFDGDNTNDLAHVYFQISEKYTDQNHFHISIWHEENTHLNELTLTFPNILSSRLMYILPGGSWPPMEFCHTEDGKGTVVGIPEFGFIGEGTVNMEFRLIRYSGDALNELYCYVDMQLSKDEGLKTIKYNAETYLEATVPGEI